MYIFIFVILLVKYSFTLSDNSCNASFNSDQGEIISFKTINDSSKDVCEWSITVSQNMSILLTIEEIKAKYWDKLYVYDGTSENDKLLVQYYGNYEVKNFVSSANNLFIKFVYDSYHSLLYDYYRKNITIKMTYKAVPFGCGLDLDETQSVIYSPGYPNGYYNKITCDWKITVPPNNSIVLVFEDFQTENDMDYLSIGASGLGFLNSRHSYSGNVKPQNFISASNSVELSFTTNADVIDRGFKITYKMKELELNTTFLISASNVILRSDLNQTKTVALSGHKITELIDYDINKETVVWFDPEKHKIIVNYNNRSDKHTNECHINGRPNSLALDWIHDLIYWIDIQSKTIKVLDIKNLTNIYTISDLNDENPRDLIINIQKSALIWSNVGIEPNIMESNLDGSNKTIIYSNSRQANHLTVDYQTQRYYFIDIKDFYLYSIDFNGLNEIIFIQSKENFDSITSMTVLNNDLYLSNEYMILRVPEIDLRIARAQVLYKIHRFPIYETKYYFMVNPIDIDRQYLHGFKIIDPLLQPIGINRCELTECLYLCLPTRHSFRCLIPDSMNENLDNKSKDVKTKDDITIDNISIINSVFIGLLILIIVVLSLITLRLYNEMLKIKNGFNSTLNARISLHEVDSECTDSLNFDHHLKSNQNLLEIEDNSSV